MSHTNYNTGEPCDCDRPDSLREILHAIDAEIKDLVEDIDAAQRRAINGRWSMECDWLVERIANLFRVGGLRPSADEVAVSSDLFNYAMAQVLAALVTTDGGSS